MPHKTVHLKNDRLANCNGSLYAAWIQEKAPFDQLTADSIAHDILWITGKTPFPLDQMAIIEAMSQQEPGFTLPMKLFLFGYLCGVHKQRRKDRSAEQSRRLLIAQNPFDLLRGETTAESHRLAHRLRRVAAGIPYDAVYADEEDEINIRATLLNAARTLEELSGAEQQRPVVR